MGFGMPVSDQLSGHDWLPSDGKSDASFGSKAPETVVEVWNMNATARRDDSGIMQ